MRSNPLLEEIWETRREFDRLAGGDLDELCRQTRAWAEANLPPESLIRPEDLPAYFAKLDEQERAAGSNGESPTLDPASGAD